MNAVQSKQLTTAARSALALLDNWRNSTGFDASTVAKELRLALAAPREAPKLRSIKSSKLWWNAASAEHAAWLATGETIKAFHQRVLDGFCRAVSALQPA
jgi:hypothetical protein